MRGLSTFVGPMQGVAVLKRGGEPEGDAAAASQVAHKRDTERLGEARCWSTSSAKSAQFWKPRPPCEGLLRLVVCPPSSRWHRCPQCEGAGAQRPRRCLPARHPGLRSAGVEQSDRAIQPCQSKRTSGCSQNANTPEIQCVVAQSVGPGQNL